MNGKQLMQKAFENRKKAYAPYSKFLVGAAVLMKNGEVIGGCNIENASYGLCNCAERTALFTSVVNGYTRDDIVAIAIATTANPPATPCGACRQVMNELMAPDAIVYYGNEEGFVTTTVSALLPSSFNKESL